MSQRYAATCKAADVPTIAVFAPVGATAASVVVPKEMLAKAADAAARRGSGPPDRVVIASTDGAPVRCGGDILVEADAGIDDLDSCDLIWVGAYWSDLYQGAEDNAAGIRWIAEQHRAGAEVVGHGPGSFLLAEAGLLSGRIATTYRTQVRAFRRRHPDVDLQPQRAITSTGTGVYCALGITSGLDLLVALIGRRYGHEVASGVAAWSLYDTQRRYRAETVAFDGQKYHGDEAILEVQTWLETNFRKHDISMEDVAMEFGMSGRTLIRRFKSATGDSFSEYVRRLRVESAKDLLRNTDMTITEISSRVGYRDIGAFYDVFAKHTGQRPKEFRDVTSTAP